MNGYDIDRKVTLELHAAPAPGAQDRIKPLHGINNAPYIYGSARHMHYLKEAHIPYSRLHDTGGAYGGFRYVDIANVFRDFDADETRAENYDFVATDHLIVSLKEQGVQAFYRLGCTIENDPFGKAYRTFPPADNAKWARICEHIIRHYNEGWADGYRLGLEYWEIWNEPDNEPEIDANPMWRGTMEQFFELYRVTACHLKRCFPALKIGGYASCGFYSVVQAEAAPDAHISPRTAYFTEFFLKFMEFISAPETRAPLDFFSWHSYAAENDCVRFAEFARETLDRFGFAGTESIFNEWNTGVALRGTVADASNIASMMITMHDAPVDKMMYYDGQFYSTYGGLFDPMRFRPLKAYYAFKAYGELYADGERRKADVPEHVGVKVIASRHRALLVNRLPSPVYVTINSSAPGMPEADELYILDDGHDLEKVNWDRRHIPLAPFALALVTIN